MSTHTRSFWYANRYWPTRAQALDSSRREQAATSARYDEALTKAGLEQFQFVVVPGEAYTMPNWPDFALVTHAASPNGPTGSPLQAAVFRGKRTTYAHAEAQTWPELLMELLGYRLRGSAGSNILRTLNPEKHPEHTLEFILSAAQALEHPVPETAEQAVRDWIAVATDLYGQSRRMLSWWWHQIARRPERLIAAVDPATEVTRSDGFVAVEPWWLEPEIGERVLGAYPDQATADQALAAFQERNYEQVRLTATSLYASPNHPEYRATLTPLPDNRRGQYCTTLFQAFDLNAADIQDDEREFLLVHQLHSTADANDPTVALLKLVARIADDTFTHWPKQSPGLIDLPLGALALNSLALPKVAQRRLTEWKESALAAQAQYQRAIATVSAALSD